MADDNCPDISTALDSITSLAELEGFLSAIRNPALKTKHCTEDDMRRIALMKIEFQQKEARA